jgi:hypothetical protein
MDYQKIYDDFIADRLLSAGPTGYAEQHHIVPRALGGTDETSNMIHLTARDHYFAHCCLAKIHGGEMWAALHLMAHTQKPQHGAQVFTTGRMFAISREQSAKVRSADMVDAWASGRFKRNRVYGPATEETRAKIAAAGRGRKPSPESIAKRTAAAQAKAPWFDFVNIETGAVFAGTARDFQRHSGVGQAYTSRLVRGDVGVAKGWVLKGNESAPRGNRDRTVRVFRHRDGRVFEGTAYDFNRAHIQDSGMLSNCVNGKNGVKSARGWVYVGQKENA